MTKPTIAEASCADDYDPNSMPVDKARAFIHRFLEPLTATLRVPIRDALGRVLAEDVISPVDVPSHRNSAMDGWAMRGADLRPDGETHARRRSAPPSPAGPSRARWAPGSACAS